MLLLSLNSSTFSSSCPDSPAVNTVEGTVMVPFTRRP